MEIWRDKGENNISDCLYNSFKNSVCIVANCVLLRLAIPRKMCQLKLVNISSPSKWCNELTAHGVP